VFREKLDSEWVQPVNYNNSPEIRNMFHMQPTFYSDSTITEHVLLTLVKR